jgi:cytochrome c oxidase subunit 2
MTIDLLMRLVHGLMLVLFAGWAIYFVYVLWRFRKRRQPRASYAGAKGTWAAGVEVGVIVAEGVLLVGFALPIWSSVTSAGPIEPNAVVVRVVAEQFVWNVHYPGADGEFGRTALDLITPTNPLGLDRASPAGKDDVVLLSEMHLPVGRPVVVHLSSKDVIHSFGVHAFRVKQDAIPGTRSMVRFTPASTGEFEIACSQLCGVGHHRMRGVITVESEDAFRAFLAKEAAAQKQGRP